MGAQVIDRGTKLSVSERGNDRDTVVKVCKSNATIAGRCSKNRQWNVVEAMQIENEERAEMQREKLVPLNFGSMDGLHATTSRCKMLRPDANF